MPLNTLRVRKEYMLVKSVGPKVLWVESRVPGTGEYFPSVPYLNYEGGDRWWCDLSSLREFLRAKSYCHLFQECDEDVEIWMACNAEDCEFQMLNDDEIVTSVQDESDPVNYETDEDEDINNESSKGPSNTDLVFALERRAPTVPIVCHRLHRSGATSPCQLIKRLQGAVLPKRANHLD
ncbi:uncharacterized protein TNCV_99171 [Trichonephila clavipes]|nr:uncharacterized protein TNCV_99171 [Trichonephila clavipes]